MKVLCVKKKIVVSVLSLSVMVLSSIPVFAAASAETSSTSGNGYAVVGENDHADIQTTAKNKYINNSEGYYDDGGWVSVESWSKAAQTWTSKGTNKAYYDFR